MEHNKLKQFVYAISRASQKLQQKQEIRDDFSSHLGKIKRLAINKRTKKETIERELALFEEKMNAILEKEIQILKREPAGERLDEIKQLLEKINSKLDPREAEKDELRRSITILEQRHAQLASKGSHPDLLRIRHKILEAKRKLDS